MSKNEKRLVEIARTREEMFQLNKLNTIVGNLYRFHYTSETANDPDPTILVVYRSGGGRLFTLIDATSKDTMYFAGLNLNHLDTDQAKAVLEEYGGKRRITGSMVKRLKKVWKSAYRVYNQDNVENFSLLDKDIYLEELSNKKKGEPTE
tara:strand:- start:727 stop:1173 length:447 start_codon:yes stop_codon:yes gene_type:complete